MSQHALRRHGAAITINQASFLSAAVVIEYSACPGCQPGGPSRISATGSSTAAVTGTTATTTQANELWIGGIGFAHRTRTLGTILNNFTAVANANSTHTTTNSSNAKVYALERIVSSDRHRRFRRHHQLLRHMVRRDRHLQGHFLQLPFL